MGLFLPIIISIFIFSTNADALNARVLVDESSLQKNFTGQFTLHSSDSETSLRNLAGVGTSFGPGHWQIQLRDGGVIVKNLKTRKTKKVSGSAFRLVGELTLGRQQVKEVHLHSQKGLPQWIVHLPVDHYLYGVMAAEVPASWPAEVLKAQAIASRTYFLFKKLERSKDTFDVRATTLDQVFSMKESRYLSIINAVNKTHGLLLVSDQTEQVFPAYFHADCGGQTSSEKKVWGKAEARNSSVSDRYCKTASKNNWSYVLDKEHLMSALRKVFYLPTDVSLSQIFPRIQGKDRAFVVDFLFSKNVFKRLSANELRKTIGFTKLKSTHFSVSRDKNDFIFTGRGYGHGVGMCQWGAQRWARKGKNYKFILSHYYPGAKIRRMDPREFESLQAQLVY